MRRAVSLFILATVLAVPGASAMSLEDGNVRGAANWQLEAVGAPPGVDRVLVDVDAAGERHVVLVADHILYHGEERLVGWTWTVLDHGITPSFDLVFDPQTGRPVIAFTQWGPDFGGGSLKVAFLEHEAWRIDVLLPIEAAVAEVLALEFVNERPVLVYRTSPGAIEIATRDELGWSVENVVPKDRWTATAAVTSTAVHLVYATGGTWSALNMTHQARLHEGGAWVTTNFTGCAPSYRSLTLAAHDTVGPRLVCHHRDRGLLSYAPADGGWEETVVDADGTANSVLSTPVPDPDRVGRGPRAAFDDAGTLHVAYTVNAPDRLNPYRPLTQLRYASFDGTWRVEAPAPMQDENVWEPPAIKIGMDGIVRIALVAERLVREAPCTAAAACRDVHILSRAAHDAVRRGSGGADADVRRDVGVAGPVAPVVSVPARERVAPCDEVDACGPRTTGPISVGETRITVGYPGSHQSGILLFVCSQYEQAYRYPLEPGVSSPTRDMYHLSPFCQDPWLIVPVEVARVTIPGTTIFVPTMTIPGLCAQPPPEDDAPPCGAWVQEGPAEEHAVSTDAGASASTQVDGRGAPDGSLRYSAASAATLGPLAHAFSRNESERISFGIPAGADIEPDEDGDGVPAGVTVHEDRFSLGGDGSLREEDNSSEALTTDPSDVDNTDPIPRQGGAPTASVRECGPAGWTHVKTCAEARSGLTWKGGDFGYAEASYCQAICGGAHVVALEVQGVRYEVVL